MQFWSDSINSFRRGGGPELFTFLLKNSKTTIQSILHISNTQDIIKSEKMIFTVACLTLLCHCVAGQYANEQDVLDAFTDVYDIMYSIRDDHAKQIQELRDNQAQFPTHIS